jgi:hypothetical protein
MRSSHKLLAAVTASGVVLCLSVSAPAQQAGNQSALMRGSETKPLAARVEQLRQKLRSVSPVFHDDSTEGRIDNVVQFFNFRNR